MTGFADQAVSLSGNHEACAILNIHDHKIFYNTSPNLFYNIRIIRYYQLITIEP